MWELWTRGATLVQIGEQLGRPKTTVEAALERARVYRAALDEVEPVRQQLLAGFWAQALDLERRVAEPHPLLDRKGDVVYVEVPHPEDPDMVRRVAAEDHLVARALHGELRQVKREIARLVGTDAATKWEITAPGGRVEIREARVVDLKARAAQIRLMPRPPAIDVTSHEVDEQKEA